MKRIRSYFDFEKARQGGLPDKQLSHVLPNALKLHLQKDARSLLVSVPFFNPALTSGYLLDQCVRALSHRTYIPGSVLVSEQEVGGLLTVAPFSIAITIVTAVVIAPPISVHAFL